MDESNKKNIVEMSETAEQDLENIVLYLRHNLSGDIVAGTMPILDEKLTGYKYKKTKCKRLCNFLHS